MRSKELNQARELIRNAIDKSPIVNITLKDGSQLNKVMIYRCQYLYDSVIDNIGDLTNTLNGELGNCKLYFGSESIQGGIGSIEQIDKWELYKEDEENIIT